jgi:glyoxylase-like metal-dependent hydrolase (beta-lactamase superfamily II)
MEIAPGIYSIGLRPGRTRYVSGHVHAYLLDDGNGLTLIDTQAEADAATILAELARLNRTPTDLKQILLTHSHRSHVMGLATLKRVSGATVYAHEWEADIIAGERVAQPVTLRRLDPIQIYPQRLGLAFGAKHPPCPVDRPLRDGDTVGPVQVMYTPGHTPGAVAFYWPERRTLFSGDNVATWPRFGAGWPGFQLNERQFRASLRRMAELDFNVIALGHGEPITTEGTRRLRSLVRSLDL